MKSNIESIKAYNCTQTVAKIYVNRGFNIVPVPYGEKSPAMKDWQNFLITHDNVASYFAHGQSNIALLTGETSNGVVDIDIDSMDALAPAETILPYTGYIYGRSSKPKSHYLYRLLGKDFKTVKFDSKDHGTIVELRGNSCCSILPHSVHPSGESYDAVKQEEILELSRSELLKSVGLLAYTTLMILEWPCEGSRHNASLGYAGFLCRSGHTEDEALMSIRLICTTVNDEELEDRLCTVKSTYEHFRNGEVVSGLSMLEDVLGKTVSETLKKWNIKVSPDGAVKSEQNDVVEKLNKKHALVKIGGKAKVLEEELCLATGVPVPRYDDIAAFKSYYQNKTLQVGFNKDGSPKMKSIASFWLNHENRRGYEGVVFDPSETIDAGKYYNLWQGFAHRPKEDESCELFLKHLKEIVCSNDEAHYNWLVSWMADMVQNPSTKPGTAVVLRGGKGSGKSLVGQYFGELFGRHFLTVSQSKHIHGNFNAHMEYCIFMLAEEAFWAGSKSDEGNFKELITGPKLMIEAKGIDARQAKNHIRIMVISNEDWVVPASEHERRFFVLDVSNAKAQDSDYFTPLWEEMRNGGQSALLHFLLNYNYSDVDLRKPPITKALMDQQIEGIPKQGKFWFKCLLDGKIHPYEHAEWPEYISVKSLADIYRSTISGIGYSDKSMQTQIGMNLKTYFGEGEIIRKRLTLPMLDNETGEPVIDSINAELICRQQTVYYLPPLEKARKLYETTTGISFDAFLKNDEPDT